MLDDARPSGDGAAWIADGEPGGARGAAAGLGTVAALVPALALAACGDAGGAGGAAAPAPVPVTVAAVSVTPVQASRFLAQSTMGATRAAVDAVVARGFDGWLADQFATPRATTH